MCKNLLSVDYQGYVYDCDFNQMLGLDLLKNGKRKIHISDLKNLDLLGNEIGWAALLRMHGRAG